MIKIAPSILAADFSKLGEEINKLEKAKADLIHIDVMDGHFAPNITIGPPVIKSLRHLSGLPFEVHLMITDPDRYVDSFIDAGADILLVHVEACVHLNRTIQKIKQSGIKAGVALNPATPLSNVEWILGDVDTVLLMTVNPGFGGQVYIDSVTEKVRKLKEMIRSRGLNVDIGADGGIGLDNVHIVTEAGVNIVVSGSAVFNADNTADIIKAMKDKSFREGL